MSAPTQATASSFEGCTVVVVDDDHGVRLALGSLLRSVGADVELLASAQELIAWTRPDRPCCVILDVHLGELSGLDAQAMLSAKGSDIPIVFVSGQGNIHMSVQAMRAGAEHFLSKPFREHDIIEAASSALGKDAERRKHARHLSGIQGRYATLTPREKEVIGHVTSGLANKQIADRMRISEITVKIHRAQVMRKMEARSLAMLVLLAQKLGVCSIGP